MIVLEKKSSSPAAPARTRTWLQLFDHESGALPLNILYFPSICLFNQMDQKKRGENMQPFFFFFFFYCIVSLCCLTKPKFANGLAVYNYNVLNFNLMCFNLLA